MPNRFVSAYNESETFRSLVQSKIDSGQLTRETVATIVRLPNLDGDEPETATARAIFLESLGPADRLGWLEEEKR
jgi:hypothetical protein